jgi:hypothetical protein
MTNAGNAGGLITEYGPPCGEAFGPPSNQGGGPPIREDHATTRMALKPGCVNAGFERAVKVCGWLWLVKNIVKPACGVGVRLQCPSGLQSWAHAGKYNRRCGFEPRPP